jgi:preprotein translocase subunit SecG
MIQLFYAIHVLICIALIVIVLLQTGKGVGLASVFGSGGGGSDTLFGSKGFGGVLAKATGVLAVAFMVSSISLSLFPRGGGTRGSVLDRLEGPPPVQEPQQTELPVELPMDEAPVESEAAPETADEQPSEAQ